jgi:hypothetical protein
MANNKAKVMEYLWLVIALFSLGVGIHKTINHGFKDSILFFLFVVVALLMWFLRKKLRENEENK